MTDRVARIAGVGGATAALVGGMIGYAVAEGAPTTQPLFYGGLVTARDGVPLEATHTVSLSLLGAATGGSALCSTPALTSEFKAGRFRIELPSGDKGCAEAIANNPDTWVELTVDGTTFPRTKVGAVPYAIEASHAQSASAVSGSQAATLLQLSAAVAALQASAARAPATPVPATAPKRAYRFVSEGSGCEYLPEINATRCTCEPGEIVVSPGGWGGPTGVISGSRFERSAPEQATDIDRARIWTMSCLTITGEPVRCIGVQAFCVQT